MTIRDPHGLLDASTRYVLTIDLERLPCRQEPDCAQSDRAELIDGLRQALDMAGLHADVRPLRALLARMEGEG